MEFESPPFRYLLINLKLKVISNTYAKIKVSKTNVNFQDEEYTNKMELTLTAFMGGEHHTQLTVNTNSDIPGQSGIGYITLGDKEVDLLIAALLERKLRVITATGDEQSIFCPNKD